MATEIVVTNSGDKVFVTAKAIGKGAPADGDKMVTDIITFPKGSQYTDLDTNKVYSRGGDTLEAGDFEEIGGGGSPQP